MPYTKLVWVDDDAPALSAANLNRIENGIADLYTILGNIEQTDIDILIRFVRQIQLRAEAEGVTPAEIINRIPYTNDGLPSADDQT